MRVKGKMAVSIGRIPCRTKEEAKAVVAKIRRYNSSNALGPWRANIAFACDDVDESWETEFVVESENNANYINQYFPYFNVNKLYADAFPQSTTGNNEKYPEISADIAAVPTLNTLHRSQGRTILDESHIDAYITAT